MNCNQRIEALLNRAGQTISDLPKATKYSFAYGKKDILASIVEPIKNFECCEDGEDIDVLEYRDYIMHLTDIIDRMELAIENVCGERDYLKQIIEQQIPCEICVTKECRSYDEPCNSCLRPDGKTMVIFEYGSAPEDWSMLNYEYAGVPEDRRVDDE
ncbi:MAG: hypothetical protein J6A79_07445 [Clostridia bacterium]|nr:hypothetical protein [Clostridia bacterium]